MECPGFFFFSFFFFFVFSFFVFGFFVFVVCGVLVFVVLCSSQAEIMLGKQRGLVNFSLQFLFNI